MCDVENFNKYLAAYNAALAAEDYTAFVKAFRRCLKFDSEGVALHPNHSLKKDISLDEAMSVLRNGNILDNWIAAKKAA